MLIWAHFKERFVWRPRPQCVIDYPKGTEGPITHRCADAAGDKIERLVKPANVRVRFGKVIRGA